MIELADIAPRIRATLALVQRRTLIAVGMALALACWACEDRPPPTPKPQPQQPAPKPKPPPYPETSWPKLVKQVEAGKVIWLLEAAERRVFATLRGGEELVSTAPKDDALRKLVDRVDPKREHLVATWQHRDHREVPWKDIPKLFDQYLVYSVQQNRGRRVLITTMTKALDSGPSFVTLQPHHRDIEALLPEKHDSGLFVKSFDWHEITWPEAKRLMTDNDVTVSLAHVGRVIIRVDRSAGPRYLSIEPKTNDAVHWIEANKPGSILTVE